ncbi:apolipoprotein B receptor isoform X5 [Hyaena hyaena]|uniref:apolipoprotein B receptor isoform X5 n=1 Tax=Hyaena hyaena TaxID=95912 RepID=UPI001921C5ED|nr:apolipoprotein B receptor isoform X5 [Hyaena hyaena]
MDFLRLHLPGLHQALRGALDSLGTFVSYLLGDEVPTAERREARPAKELGEVAAGRPEKTDEQEAQEALEGLGGKGGGGRRGPGEAGRCQEGGSAAKQTWGWEEGSCHGSQANRQDTGAWEGPRGARCQAPGAHSEAKKPSEAGSKADRDNSSQAEESQGPDEQEVNREGTLRTWEQEEETEEVRERKAGVAGKAESEWTWHREPEGKVAGGSRESFEQAFQEAVAEEIQGPGAREAGREDAVMVVLGACPSTRVQNTQESETECEAGATSGREEAGTASGGEEGRTASGGEEEAGAASGGEEEAGAASSGEEEAGAASGGEEEAGAGSGREEEARAASGGEEEAGAGSGGEEEAGAASGGEEEAGAASGGEEEGRTASGREEEARAASGGEEKAGAASGREEKAETTSGGEEPGVTLGRVEAKIPSVEKEGDLAGARDTEYGAVASGERVSEGTRRTWALEEGAGEDQEEEAGENRKAEMSFPRKRLQPLGTEGMEEAGKDERAGREPVEGQGPEGEGEGFEVQADQGGEEAEGRHESVDRTVSGSLEEVVQAEKAKEEGEGCWISEAELPTSKVANGAEVDAGLEATPESSLEKMREEKNEGEAQAGGETLASERSGLEPEVTEGQDPGLMAGSQIPTEQPEEGQGDEEEPWAIPALNKEETERSLEEYPRIVACGKPDASGIVAQRRDVERGDSQQEKADAEEEEEAVGGQASKEAEAEGGRESVLPDVPEAGGEWKKAEEAEWGAVEGEAPRAQSQALGGRLSAEAGTGPSLGESGARESEDEDVAEATVPCRADTTSSGHWGLEEAALSLQEDTGAGFSAAEVVGDEADGRAAVAGGGPKREAGEAWESEGRQEPGGGEELVEAAWEKSPGGPEFGPESSADMEVNGRGGQAEAFEAREGEPRREGTEVRESAGAEGGCEMDGLTSGSPVERAEGTMATGEAEGVPGGQTLLEKEASGVQWKEQGQGSEGQCGDHHPEEEAQRPFEVEDVELTEDQRAEAEEIVPEGLEAEPGPRGETAGLTGGDAHSGSWSEALLPGSRLDVSVSRSRVLLSRSSSQRRSRPSFRRPPAPERQEEPPSPPPEEECLAPEPRLLQPEEPREASPPRPEGTPLPARRRPLGHGFGLAHSGMMQELQARLGRPRPQ